MVNVREAAYGLIYKLDLTQQAQDKKNQKYINEMVKMIYIDLT